MKMSAVASDNHARYMLTLIQQSLHTHRFFRVLYQSRIHIKKREREGGGGVVGAVVVGAVPVQVCINFH